MNNPSKFCINCGTPLAPGVRFCAQCGASVTEAVSAGAHMPTIPGSSTNASPQKKGSGFKGCGFLLLLIFICGVAGQLGWHWWKKHQKQEDAHAFYALARPMLGTWKVVEDPGAARYSYTTRFMTNSCSSLPGEAPEALHIDCVENPRAPQWVFSRSKAGELVGGGIDQTSSNDIYTAHGTAALSADGQRLTLHMIWEGSREVTTVLVHTGSISIPIEKPPSTNGQERNVQPDIPSGPLIDRRGS